MLGTFSTDSCEPQIRLRTIRPPTSKKSNQILFNWLGLARMTISLLKDTARLFIRAANTTLYDIFKSLSF